MAVTIGIDVACRAAHQASAADEKGVYLWSGHRFSTTPEDLERLWARLPAGEAVTVVLEPTRNAWVPVAAWLRRRGARVVLVPTEQSADLREYYSKHAKNDRLDSRMLARLPLLHPDGLIEYAGDGPADPLRRQVRQRSTLVKRRTAVLQRLDALLELLGPAWYDALTSNYGKAALELLAQHADPRKLQRMGRTRLTRFLIRHSRGAWREDKADLLLTAAAQSLALWGSDGFDFAELAEDIALEARQAIMLTEQIDDIEERIANSYEQADPKGIVASAPGLGPVLSAAIIGRLGDASRFRNLSAVRGYSGMVPKTSLSGIGGSQHGLTKAGDPYLREALFLAADQARRADPQLADKYRRLIEAGKHHNSALCTLSTVLLTRIAACWRSGMHYQLRDLDGTEIDAATSRARAAEITADLAAKRQAARKARTSQALKSRTGRRSKESQSAPSTGPSTEKSIARRVDVA